jgi:hypothetical protein
MLIVADCASLRRAAGLDLPTCQNGRDYRAATRAGAPTVETNRAVPFLDADGNPITITAPSETLDLRGAFFSHLALIRTTPTSPLGITADTLVFYRLPPSITEIDKFAAALADVAPGATLQVFDLDLSALEAFRVHRGVIRTGILLAFLLGMIAFAVSTAGRAVERRRDVSALVAVGVPRSTLRAVQQWQQLVPLTVVLLASAAVGHLAGNALLKLQGHQSGWYGGTVDAAWPLVGIGLLTATLLSSVVVGLRPRAEDLRRE